MTRAISPSFGIATAPQQVSYEDLLRVWLEADTVPQIEHAWVFDHLLPIAGPAGWNSPGRLRVLTQVGALVSPGL
jgi:hypothetical protein